MQTSNQAREPLLADPIEVWCLPLAGATCGTAGCGGELTADEEAQLDRIVSATRRRRIRAAWVARRVILARVLDCGPRAVTIRRQPGKAPTVETPGRPLYSSLSHSVDWMLFAISRTRRVGVDIEHVDPKADVLRLARRFFRADEIDGIAALTGEEQSLAFFRAWSRKEAVLKAIGGGVPSRLRSVHPGLGEGTEPGFTEGIPWAVRSLKAPGLYVAALAASGGALPEVLVRRTI
jgi:4'-phosphopantetheinyl transferase